MIDELRQRLATLEERVVGLETRTRRFKDIVEATPQYSCREIIMLWLETHETLPVHAVAVELRGSWFSAHSLAVCVSRMHYEGRLLRIEKGIYIRNPQFPP